MRCIRLLTMAVVALLVEQASLPVASAQARRKTGLTGAAFLKVGVGAKNTALGSAVTSLTGDVNQIFMNPAGTALNEGQTQVTYTRNQWIADLAQNAAAVTHSFGDLGTIGVGVVQMGVSGIESDRDVVPNFILQAGTFKPNDLGTSATYDYSDLAIPVVYARRVTDRLALGGGVKLVTESIDDQKATTFGFDFGATYDVGYRDLTLGARINNLGPDLEYYNIGVPLPLIFSIGASINLVKDADNVLRVMADATKPQDNAQLVFAGAEYKLNDTFALRGGYKLNYSGRFIFSDQTLDNDVDRSGLNTTEEGVTFGAGLEIPYEGYRLAMDYAFTEFGVLQNVHRFTFAFTFK